MQQKRKQSPAPPALAKGQLWKLSHAYIHIVELGKRLISYRMFTNLNEKGVRTQMSDITTMWGYLTSRHAELVKESFP